MVSKSKNATKWRVVTPILTKFPNQEQIRVFRSQLHEYNLVRLSSYHFLPKKNWYDYKMVAKNCGGPGIYVKWMWYPKAFFDLKKHWDVVTTLVLSTCKRLFQKCMKTEYQNMLRFSFGQPVRSTKCIPPTNPATNLVRSTSSVCQPHSSSLSIPVLRCPIPTARTSRKKAFSMLWTFFFLNKLPTKQVAF